MKKILLILVSLVLGIVSFAQSGGDDYVFSAFSKRTMSSDFVIQNISNTIYCYPSSDSIKPFNSTSFNTVIDSCISLFNDTIGGKITIGSGTYDDLDRIIIPSGKNKIVIKGSGMFTTILKVKDNLDASLSGLYLGLIHFSGCDNIIISDLALDGNGATMSNIGATGVGVHGISNWDSVDKTSSDCIVENVYIHDFTRDALAFCGYRNKAKQCVCINNYWNGPTLTWGSYYCEVSGCYVTGSADVGISAYGQNHDIFNNVVWDCNGSDGSLNTGWGIATEDNAFGSSMYTKVHDNKVYGDLRYGIYDDSADYSEIYNNTIYSASNTGAGIGILLTGSTYANVHGNVVYETYGSAIRVSGANYNKISNNSFETATDASVDAIDIRSNSSYNTVKGNYAKGKERGLAVQAGSVTNRFIGNDFEGTDGNDTYDGGTNTRFKSNWGVKAGSWITDY